MSCSEIGCKGHQRFCGGGWMIRHGSPALKIPVLLIALNLLSGTSVTLAQCEVHEDAKLTASDAASNDGFGVSVSVSGDVTIVGAVVDDCGGGLDCGSAYIYRFNPGAPGQWIQETKLTASDAAPYDQFGYSVSVSGGVAVVGAWFDDCAAGLNCGAAYVYRFNGSTWVEEQKLTASDAAQDDKFGVSVSVSGDVAIVGVSFDDCPDTYGTNCGSAYVYRFNGSTWVQEAKLANPEAQFDLFGGSVSVNGNVVVVGASLDDCAAGLYCGSAYVYRFNGSTWIQQAKLTASDAAPFDAFGGSVSVSGDVAVVGAYFDDCADGPNCGSAYVYRFNGNTWVQEAKLTASDAAADDTFGLSVSLSGDVAVLGALGDDCAAGDFCGAAYMYRFDGNTWVQQAKLTASDARAVDTFGAGVSISGDIAVVGTQRDDCTAGGDCGSAYVFALADCNANSILDGCEFADCNTNCIPDDQDISAGTSRDCNGNSIPDECDIAACTRNPFCTDCNGNGIPDRCDIANGTSADCNGDLVPDECDELLGSPLRGACCNHDPFGGCTDGVSCGECSCPQCAWTEFASCDDVTCLRKSIPTVSAWGLAILTLLLMTGAKVRFGRMQQS